MLLPLHCGVHHHPYCCTALHSHPKVVNCPQNMRRTTKTSTTTQTKRRKEKRWEEMGLWACADLMPHSYPTARIASEIAIHTWDCKCKAAEYTGKVCLFLCLCVCLSLHMRLQLQGEWHGEQYPSKLVFDVALPYPKWSWWSVDVWFYMCDDDHKDPLAARDLLAQFGAGWWVWRMSDFLGCDSHVQETWGHSSCCQGRDSNCCCRWQILLRERERERERERGQLSLWMIIPVAKRLEKTHR